MIELNSLQDFQKWVKEFSRSVLPQTIVLLSGDLGTGKTEFVKNFVQERVGKEAVSPTFSLHHHYEGDLLHKCEIEHWDLYRLESEDELESSGFWDQFVQTNKIVLIEWPERINQTFLPLGWKRVNITIELSSKSPSARLIKLL